MIQPPRKGERITSRFLKSVTNLTKSIAPSFSGTPGLDFTQAPGGTLYDYVDPTKAIIVFVVGINGAEVLVKRAFATASGYTVDDSNSAILKPDLAPGTTANDFQPFAMLEPQPGFADTYCRMIDGILLPPGEGGGGGSANLIAGKVIDVNLHAQVAVVAPMLPGIDPSVGSQWANNSNFNIGGSLCCWIMGRTAVDVDHPAMIMGAANVGGFPWMISPPQLTNQNFRNFCRPSGLFAPTVGNNCSPPPDDPICEMGACCQNNNCDQTIEVVCDDMGGTFYIGETCQQAAANHPEMCAVIRPCCLPDGTCIDATESDCNSMEGEWQDSFTSCNDADCQQPSGCCVLIDGQTIGDQSPSQCASVLGAWFPCACEDIANPFNPFCP